MTSDVDYSSTGFGVVLRAEGNTVLSENLYANIGLDIRYDANGEPSDSDGNKITNFNENVNFNSLSIWCETRNILLIRGS